MAIFLEFSQQNKLIFFIKIAMLNISLQGLAPWLFESWFLEIFEGTHGKFLNGILGHTLEVNFKIKWFLNGSLGEFLRKSMIDLCTPREIS